MPARETLHDDLIGVTIADRYRIVSRLGAGGMGTAYRAWDEENGIPVVIKIPKKVFLEDPRFAERFQREIRLLQGLTHTHIVPIFDVGEHEGLPFVAMRLLPGGSLSNRRLRDAAGRVLPNPPGMLHLWLPAIAEALDFVHANGVVHRDVKPANIFFDAFWGAYLGDFGIAKVVEESDAFDEEHTLTATHMGIGTEEYMAPEQFKPKTVIDGRADQYALAVVVYELMAATRPFTGATAHLIVETTTHQVPPLQVHRHDLPPALVHAVHRGLAKTAPERFASCREFAAAVLHDVPRLDDEPNAARLLCPQCSRVLRLPLAAAGRQGTCGKCHAEMEVAADLSALWLLTEARVRRSTNARLADFEFTSTPSPSAMAEDYAESAFEGFTPIPVSPSAKKRRPRPRRQTNQGSRKSGALWKVLAVLAALPPMAFVVVVVYAVIVEVLLPNIRIRWQIIDGDMLLAFALFGSPLLTFPLLNALCFLRLRVPRFDTAWTLLGVASMLPVLAVLLCAVGLGAVSVLLIGPLWLGAFLAAWLRAFKLL